ncbi:unnamed protein product [Strongylus vulgaris]|uniref:Uncharacterized protein n=1 Tax=Strongylus vulgaris TaxID=40348 RepID=A0A3P7I8D8_STRVU|nr:unnamed protein product [Strongylus vulgaris]
MLLMLAICVLANTVLAQVEGTEGTRLTMAKLLFDPSLTDSQTTEMIQGILAPGRLQNEKAALSFLDSHGETKTASSKVSSLMFMDYQQLYVNTSLHTRLRSAVSE